MRTVIRAAAVALAMVPLTGCSVILPIVAAGNAAGNVASRPAGGSAVFKSGPLGVLPVPSGARPWHRDVAAPMPAKAFVQGFYEKSAQSHEEGRFARRRYQSGIIRGWDTASGAVQDVNIMRFATVNGAASEFDELTSALDDQLGKGGKDVTDSADGARGTANPMRDAHGYAEVELAARVGRDEVVDVHERTLSKPDPGAAKALLLKQVNALKGRH